MKYLLLLIALFITKLSGAQTVFQSSCPSDSPISCSSSQAASCCFESPGGVLLQTQFWDYSPATGPNNLFTLHGLWPDNCDGTYQQFCDSSLQISDDGSTIKDIIVNKFNDQELYDNLSNVWKDINGNDQSLWAHEWNKHGTCINTINPSCYSSYETNEDVYDYYKILYQLFENLPTYQWLTEAGIKPSNSVTYTKSQIQNALSSKFGQQVYFKCDSSNALNEIWYFHHIKGSLLQQNFVPIAPLSNSNCPSSGIKFPLKGGSDGSDPAPTNTQPGSTPTGFPSTSYITLSGKNGCLISNGKYYTSGTCATYHFTAATYGGVVIKSSKGGCGVDSNNNFVCGSDVDDSKNQFQIKNGQIGYGGNYDWCLGSSSGGQTIVYLSNGKCSSFTLNVSGN
ncbi:unnamed protein product [Candida verbasci]|uniref:Ribonuclease T2-like n=1 Tax=Candida verbasci TaxID=1227364 RepID=A0A9W4XMT9_9ASCO|nr:unnamed protein product [Candida verbasci]